jgi:hypothetical protein
MIAPRIGGLKLRMRSQRIPLSTILMCFSPHHYNERAKKINFSNTKMETLITEVELNKK